MKRYTKIFAIVWCCYISVIIGVSFVLYHYLHVYTDRMFWFRESVTSDMILLALPVIFHLRYGKRIVRFFYRWIVAMILIKKLNIQ
jgi:hypothetical protein